jgi:SAM-dependent methyltransferase
MPAPARHQTAETIRDDFDRIALLPDDRWNHNRHYHPLLLREVPAGSAEALDVGCGAGEFTRLLAARCTRVTGIDLSPNMVAEARRRSAVLDNVEYAVGDVMTAPLATGRFDCIAGIAVLHHLPLEAGLTRLRDLLRPGGVLVLLDLSPGRLPADLGALAVSIVLGTWHNGPRRSSPEEREAWAAHGSTDRYPSLAEVRATCERVLPGARVRKHLLWRYSLVWRGV